MQHDPPGNNRAPKRDERGRQKPEGMTKGDNDGLGGLFVARPLLMLFGASGGVGAKVDFVCSQTGFFGDRVERFLRYRSPS